MVAFDFARSWPVAIYIWNFIKEQNDYGTRMILASVSVLETIKDFENPY